ncbi:MAG: ergothioneine biosynthesis protein EgtC [Myxococcaceae bacterium]|nr:ergothioneine biosynthesis protein EgtC [Myxococcaceae bacterium]
MCRIAGFLGFPCSLTAVLTEPTRSLRQQGRAPRELPEGMLGSDGYGFAWLTEHGGQAARYRQTLPIWSDSNLDTLAPFLEARCFVAATRTAQDNMPVAITNTPPFCFGRTMLVHNGSIGRFHTSVLEALRARLGAETRSAVQGNTDSEYLAALLADTAGEDLEARVRGMLRFVRERVTEAGTEAQLNVIAADGAELVAAREAIDEPAPSLYYLLREGVGAFVASEPLTEDETWTRVPDGQLLRASYADGRVVIRHSTI